MPAAPTPKVKRARRVSRVTEEELRHGEHHVVLAVADDVPGEALKRDERVVSEMTDRLRRARAAGRELPERDVVLARLDRVELVGRTRDRLVEGPADDEDVRREAQPLPGLADARMRRLVDHDDARARVAQVVRIVLWQKERVDLGDDAADLQRREPGGDELRPVGEREQHPILRPHAELEENVADPVRQA